MSFLFRKPFGFCTFLYMSPFKAAVLLAICCLIQLNLKAQSGCPGFTPGAVGNANMVVNFYTSTGILVSSCPCQLTGAGIKCSTCTPAAGTWFYCTFSILGITVTCYTDAVLGVHWGEIVVRQAQGVVQINWSTLMEVNNEKFIIERSSDGQKVESVGWIEGAGSSNSVLNYSFIDPNPDPNLPYYRIVQLDFDGKVDYSDWFLPTEKSQEVMVNIIPNPSDGNFSIFLSKSVPSAGLTLLDNTGREVMVAKLSGGVNKFKTNLAPGHYIGWIITEDEKKKLEISVF